MNITLTNYHLFDTTKAIANFGRNSWNDRPQDWIDTSKKVGKLALTILAIIPAIILDLVLFPISLAYRSYYPAQNPLPQPVVGPQPVRAGKIPDPQLINRIAAHPYPIFPEEISHTDFFRDSLRAAFEFHDPAKAAIYKELIEDGGAGDAAPPVEIFQWAAGSLIAHYLRSRNQSDRTNELFPKTCPEPREPLIGIQNEERTARNVAHSATIERLREQYNDLPREEKAAALLQVIVPEEVWQLTRKAENLVRAIRAHAHAITQNHDYNIQIYGPVTAVIANI